MDLYLVDVIYPQKFDIPKRPISPLFLEDGLLNRT
jgi:tRNA pseudouridine synthase A